VALRAVKNHDLFTSVRHLTLALFETELLSGFFSSDGLGCLVKIEDFFEDAIDSLLFILFEISASFASFFP